MSGSRATDDSRTPRPAEGATPPTVAIALSGGRDSTALLHVTARQALSLGVQVVGLHVHHNLQPEADAWLAHLKRQVARWARSGLPIRLVWTHLTGSPQRGDSIEAWARRERYAALAQMAKQSGAPLILLAHHAQDQAETFLLQALRGGGAAGLAAMPPIRVQDGLTWARPWLNQDGQAIAQYVKRHRLAHIHDPSNDSQRFARNRLRHAVLPHLVQAFPDALDRFADAARSAAMAAALMQEVGQQDLARVSCDEGLRRSVWLALSPARRQLVLQIWLSPISPSGVPQSLLERLCAQWPNARNGSRWPLHGGRQLGHYGDVLAALNRPSAPPASPPRAPEGGFKLMIEGPGRYALPQWGGALVLTVAESGGIATRCGAYLAHPRLPGAQFQQSVGGVPRSLKKCFQAQAIPAWQRNGPVLSLAGQLLWVPGLGVDVRHAVPEGLPQWQVAWVEDDAAL